MADPGRAVCGLWTSSCEGLESVIIDSGKTAERRLRRLLVVDTSGSESCFRPIGGLVGSDS